MTRMTEWGSKPDVAASAEVREIRARIHRELLDRLNLASLGQRNRAEGEREVASLVRNMLEAESVPLNFEEREIIVEQINDEIFGLGPLEPLLKDDSVSDILVNGAGRVFVERNGKLHPTEVSFKDDQHLLQVIDRIVSAVGRRIDDASPMVDARLEDGSRVNAIIPPLALDGPHVSIRKFRRDVLSAEELLANGSLTEPILEFMQAAVRARLNILISGGTGSGKTTFLNVLSERDSRRRAHRHHRGLGRASAPPAPRGTPGDPAAQHRGRGRGDQRVLVLNSLRMRPDRIIVGEVRSAEALDMLQAMNTGHDGSMTTLHANSPRDALAALETMVQMAGLSRGERDAPAGRVGHRHHRAPGTSLRRRSPRDPRGRDRGHGGRRHHHAGPLPVPPSGGRRGGQGRRLVRGHGHSSPGRRAAPIRGHRPGGDALREHRWRRGVVDAVKELLGRADVTSALAGLLVVALSTASLVLLWESLRSWSRQRKSTRALRKLRTRDETAPADAATRPRALLNEDVQGLPAWLQTWLLRLPHREDAQRMLEQAGLRRWSVATLFLSALGGAAAGSVLAWSFGRSALLALVGAGAGGSIPFLWLKWKRNKRLRAFEERFPEAIDLLARAARAGHSFASGLHVVAEESEEPVASEFRQVHDEQRFGLPMNDALLGLADRVSMPDVRIFVTAVMIQRESGGNLAENLDGLSEVIRGRFRFRRDVRTKTAHGRITGTIVALAPMVAALGMYTINPGYMRPLFTEPLGHVMLLVGLAMMGFGFLVIRRMVDIEI